MKTIVRILTRMILILLILMNISGCIGESSGSSDITTDSANNKDASGYVLVDTGQVVCFEHIDGHVTCTCSR